MAATLSDSAQRWIVTPRNLAAEERLQKELGLPTLIAALLAQRGIVDPEQAHKFLNPSLDDLHDPSLLPDYEAAKNAILGARERGELIFVHGDYDVDGVTSAAILSRFLNKIGCKVHTHVPHRMKEGYGINLSAVEDAKQRGAKLFLTCDCGIGAHEQVAMAREAGMTVVVTDHHLAGEELPDAQALVNPHRADSKYPFGDLCGAGVVFKLCAGITRDLGFPVQAFYRAYLDLATLGTIADVMPLVGENRIIARHGLALLPETKKAGIQALMREAKIAIEPGKSLRSYHIGFLLGPRLNAAGRLDDSAMSLKLLLENDPGVAEEIAHQLEDVNTARKAEQQRIIDEASDAVISQGLQEKNVIVVCGENWHSGVVGIVAGRLVESFRRPCFVMAVDPATGVAKGSARSIPNFHLAKAIWAFPELFLSGGGHALAAGCSFNMEKYPQVLDALDKFAGERLTPEDFLPTLVADLEIDSSDVTIAACEKLADLEPFGLANPEPTFLARNVTLSQVKPTRNPAHAQLLLRQPNGLTNSGIAFNIGEQLYEMGAGSEVDMMFQPSVDEWRGNRNLKWQVKAVRTKAD